MEFDVLKWKLWLKIALKQTGLWNLKILITNKFILSSNNIDLQIMV